MLTLLLDSACMNYLLSCIEKPRKNLANKHSIKQQLTQILLAMLHDIRDEVRDRLQGRVQHQIRDQVPTNLQVKKTFLLKIYTKNAKSIV